MNRSLLVGGVVALVGCSAGAQGPVDARAFLDAMDVQGAADIVPSPDVPVGHVVDSGCDASGSCNADFPCGGRRFACLGAAQWQRVVTRDCSFVCGCVPCSGASCEPDGPVESCATGTTCTVPSLGSGALDTRATPCEVPVPDEGVEVRTARVRGLLVGSWSGHRFSPGVEETFFYLDLRADGSVAIRCPYQSVPCSPFGFAAPGDGGGRSWTLDQVGAVYGQGTLRMVTAAGSLRTMSLTNMVFLPSTRSFNTFSFLWTPDDAGASVQYNLSRAD